MLVATALSLSAVPRVEIAPGVLMPQINFGVQKNHTASIDLGAMGLDTALIYGDRQQKEVGAAVREAVTSGVARSQIFVTSKIPCCPGTRFDTGIAAACLLPEMHDPTKAIEHDFKILGLDYIDLMLMHWPCDDFEHSVATYKAMEPYVKSGKIKAIGVSNFNASALNALLPRVSVKPSINQCACTRDSNPRPLPLTSSVTCLASAHHLCLQAPSPLRGTPTTCGGATTRRRRRAKITASPSRRTRLSADGPSTARATVRAFARVATTQHHPLCGTPMRPPLGYDS